MQLEDIFQELLSSFIDADIHVSDYKEINYGIQFRLAGDEGQGVVRIYQNKKGETKYDYSQLGGGQFAQKIISLIEPQKQGAEAIEIGLPMIGADESGKGDFFGPLVCAAVYVDERTEMSLKAMNIRDSKNVSDNMILNLAQQIRTLCSENIFVTALMPAEYNALYKEFTSRGEKLNALLARAHAKTIRELAQRTNCRNILLDQFGSEALIHQALGDEALSFHITQVHRAERNTAVAAASIIARSVFLQSLKKLESRYGMEFPKGASSQVIQSGKSFVKQFGKAELENVAKLHFKTAREIIGKLGS